MLCIWSLQTCYMHACIKSAYMRVNLSEHAPSHASWTHAYWHGHTLACSVVYRGYAHMCASASMHNTAGQCVPMPLCVRPGRVGKHMPAYIHTHIYKCDPHVHVANLQAPDAQRLMHTCVHNSVHNTAGQCVPMPVCVRPGRVGRRVPT